VNIDITIATDIICGFPKETEEYFDDTMRLISFYKFPVVNISQFYPRPGTPAAKMKRIATQIVKDRSRRLTTLFESFSPYTHMVGRTEKVWFSTEISEDGHHSVGHTKGYVKVIVPLDGSLPGLVRCVKIHAAQRFHIEGEVTTTDPRVHRKTKVESRQQETETLWWQQHGPAALIVVAGFAVSAFWLLGNSKKK
jgi:threonylcarbamoyladenosine tRNA methylthiotransferase CDKAL1